MDTNNHSHPAVNTDVGFDKSDLSVRGIVIFLAGVGIAGVVSHLVIWGMFVGAQKVVPYDQNPNPMATMVTGTEAPPLTNAGPQSVVSFPEPRLQTDDTADMSKFKEEEDKHLYAAHPYQGADGTIHLNINDAMALVAQRGLPTRQAGQQPTATANTDKQTAPKPAAGAKPAAGSPGVQ
ncbi:hypothetical protein Acid345_2998 [Candidatus Koribacter versatilis Ellin345]|uniref:Uncharacterized protein n=1 Tax=Koribacter versatilis (strain Ellin345) TaxID=204669 RepID=Q1IMA1_KORVE|nr:hypothetical protein [Candidatus Koribacter versatilis]ABF41999.1 hypothetical protein Acid345_2998 [Candidatus Koribacter versatilis Ellin345]